MCGLSPGDVQCCEMWELWVVLRTAGSFSKGMEDLWRTWRKEAT